MIEVTITEEMKQRAWRKSRAMGELNHSITKYTKLLPVGVHRENKQTN